MSKQDRQGARTAADIERKYNFGQTFAEVYGLVSDAQKAAETAINAVDGLDQRLDHEEIFNRLTKYGTVQGIYRGEDDDIYINASYIKSGTIAAEFIDAENLEVAAANITGLLTADKIKLGGIMDFYQSLEEDSSLAGQIGYISISSIDGFSGTALGIMASLHATLLAPSGNLVVASYGDAYINSSLGDIRLKVNSDMSVRTYGYALKFNDVNVAYVSSDRRLKKNINYEASDKLASLFDTLQPVTFEMKNEEDNQQHIGFIAQDVVAGVESVGLGDALAAVDCNGMYTLNYGEITAVLTAKVKQLENRLNDLEGV